MKLRSGPRRPSSPCSARAATTRSPRTSRVKQVIVGDGEARQRFVVARNPSEAERDRDPARADDRAARRPGSPQLEQTRGDGAREGRLQAARAPSMGRYVRQTKTGRLMVDRAKISDEARLDGKYLITTSDDTLTPEDIALGYKNLLEAERGFRDLKGTLLMRPVFHRKEDRIRAHVLVCFLALVIIRVAEIRAADTWRTIGDELGRIKLGRFRSPDGEFTQRTELTDHQRQLLNKLGVPEPPRFGDITPAPAKHT